MTKTTVQGEPSQRAHGPQPYPDCTADSLLHGRQSVSESEDHSKGESLFFPFDYP